MRSTTIITISMCNQPLDSTRWFKIFDIIVIDIDIISTTTIITIFMCHQVLEHTWFKKFLGGE